MRMEPGKSGARAAGDRAGGHGVGAARVAVPTVLAGTGPLRVALLGGALAALFALLLGGCAALPAGGSPGAGAAPDEAELLMLDDLVAAYRQLEPPRTTTLQVTRDADPLTEALVERLAEAGYGVRRVDADQGAHHLTLEHGEAPGSDGRPQTRLELVIGVTDLARSYRVERERVRPASTLAVGGTRRPVRLEDTARFGSVADPKLARVEYLGSAPMPRDMPLISLITDEVVSGVVRRAAGGPSLAGVNSGRVEVANLFYGEGEAFGEVRDTFEPTERIVVIFPNDSMRLGEGGKESIERFVQDFREESDMIGLVGCSNGPTALEIGNEGLALGRSRRVTEELLSLGVPRERVIDQGCWAPVNASDRFPSRGVVVELLRRPS